MERILEERRKKRDEVINQVKDFANEVKNKLGKVTVILYGSYARGDFNFWSDIDVILVSEAFTNVRFLDRYEMFPHKPGFEVKPYTPEEFKKMMGKISWKEALKYKVVVVDDYNIFNGTE
ncbi:nucleotidyltransferase domain-containing protein [Sulfurisphaera javensis]|uniref:Nucleotidyltransferase domain-containing protein n=1 Tax=Sulfurisphaera javensis TaxID=2049879 RepID=A0AAT9GSL4_9CREN